MLTWMLNTLTSHGRTRSRHAGRVPPSAVPRARGPGDQAACASTLRTYRHTVLYSKSIHCTAKVLSYMNGPYDKNMCTVALSLTALVRSLRTVELTSMLDRRQLCMYTLRLSSIPIIVEVTAAGRRRRRHGGRRSRWGGRWHHDAKALRLWRLNHLQLRLHHLLHLLGRLLDQRHARHLGTYRAAAAAAAVRARRRRRAGSQLSLDDEYDAREHHERA